MWKTRHRMFAPRRKVAFIFCALAPLRAHPYFCQNQNMSTELDFINKTLSHLNPPAGSSILEVGCGTGQNSQALASAGFDVTGIDTDAEKISTALDSEQDKLHFFTHDIRLPFFINYFDYAFNLFSNFGFYKTDREHNNAIRTIANSLKPQGILVLDYHNQDTKLRLGDFNDMFAYNGLQMEEVFGDYTLDAFDIKKSPRLIMIAKKK